MSSSSRYRLKAEQRSIEEIVVTRRMLSETAPLPAHAAGTGYVKPETIDVGLVLNRPRTSSSDLHLPSINKHVVVSKQRSTDVGSRSLSTPQVSDKEEVFDAVVDYCRTLQLKVQVRHCLYSK
jgi:hypothetical protein